MRRRPRTAPIKPWRLGAEVTSAHLGYSTWKGDPFGFGYVPASPSFAETIETSELWLTPISLPQGRRSKC
jgi:hypothetical protein